MKARLLSSALALPRHQFVPRALQRCLKANDCGEKYVDVAGLDLLDGSDVQIAQFSETLLSNPLRHPNPAHVGPEGHTLGDSSALGHALLGRNAKLTTTAQWGVNCRSSPSKMNGSFDTAKLRTMVLSCRGVSTCLLAFLLVALPLKTSGQDPATSQRQATTKYPDIAKAGSPLNKRFVAMYNEAKEYNPTLLSMPSWPMILADRAAGANVSSPSQKSPSPQQLGQLKAKSDAGDAKAQYYLGLMYDEELVPGVDYRSKFQEARAIVKELYKKAAEQGFAEAQYRLGIAVEVGEEDPHEAVKWYLKAAEQGLPDAQVALGFVYGRSGGVMEDQAEAARWYRKAAEQGWLKAQNLLSIRCGKGQGLPKNEAEAYKWMLLAAASGDFDSMEWVKIFDQRFTPAQRAEGKQLAQKFQPVGPSK